MNNSSTARGAMARRFVNQLADRDAVDDVFLVSEKQLRTNRNGNPYVQMRLSDRSGSLTAMLWNANERLYASFDNGDYLRAQGAAQLYNGAMQLILQRVEKVDPDSVNQADFTTLADNQVERLTGRLRELLREMASAPLRNLADCFLLDAEFLDKFRRAPAGVKNHHAYKGGLLEHVVSLMEVCRLVAPRYPDVNGDLLLMGAFLHDAGKIDELVYDRDLGYTAEGQLLGHLVQVLPLLDRKIAEAEKLSGEPFPAELALRLKHMIVSHHGEYENGSPKLPMTPEAVALHQLDTLDARLHAVGQMLREEAQPEGGWTTYNAMLGRKFYRGQGGF